MKIAVLDTGLDMDHPLAAELENRIEGQGWIEEKSQDFSDRHGHGTHIAGLLLEYVEHSEIYIAKVTEGKTTDPRTIARVSPIFGMRHEAPVLRALGYPRRCR